MNSINVNEAGIYFPHYNWAVLGGKVFTVVLGRLWHMGGWETRRLLTSQPTRLKTNCTSHETVSGNHSFQTKRKHHMFPAWEDRWAPLVLSATPAPPAGEHYWQCHLQKQRRQAQFKEKPDIRADGAGGLISRSPNLGSWTGATMYSVPVLVVPSAHPGRKPSLAKLFRRARTFLSHHHLLTPPPFHHSDP